MRRSPSLLLISVLTLVAVTCAHGVEGQIYRVNSSIVTGKTGITTVSRSAAPGFVAYGSVDTGIGIFAFDVTTTNIMSAASGVCSNSYFAVDNGSPYLYSCGNNLRTFAIAPVTGAISSATGSFGGDGPFYAGAVVGTRIFVSTSNYKIAHISVTLSSSYSSNAVADTCSPTVRYTSAVAIDDGVIFVTAK
jgi:hypothetical protein